MEKHVASRLDRRLLVTSLGLSGLGTGLAAIGLATSRPRQKALLPTGEPTGTPQASMVERSSEPSQYSLRHSSELPVNTYEIAEIANTWERFAVFEPATDIVIEPDWRADDEGYWQIDETELKFSGDLFENNPEMQERRTVELPTAIGASIISRIFAEKKDPNKIDGANVFLDFCNNNIANSPLYIAGQRVSPAVYKQGINVFNPYRYTNMDLDNDKNRYEAVLYTLEGYLGCVATSLILALEDIQAAIQRMPKIQMSDRFNDKTAIVDSPQRGIALEGIQAVYTFLEAAAVPMGESNHEGSVDEIINTLIPRIGVAKYELDIA